VTWPEPLEDDGALEAALGDLTEDELEPLVELEEAVAGLAELVRLWPEKVAAARPENAPVAARPPARLKRVRRLMRRRPLFRRSMAEAGVAGFGVAGLGGDGRSRAGMTASSRYEVSRHRELAVSPLGAGAASGPPGSVPT
jgi:hypothetical protein